MKDSALLKISIISSIVGIFIILIISEKIDLSQSQISSINQSKLNEKVKIKGYITSIKETPGLYIINIKDNTGEITAVVFKEEPLNLSKNLIIEIEGRVTKYNNKTEINADIIRI